MDKDKKNPRSPDAPVHSAEMEELYRRLQPEMRRPKPSPEAITAALEAAQRLAAEADAEQAADDTAQELSGESSMVACRVCGYRNREGNKFCGMCGITVELGLSAEDERPPHALELPRNPFLDHDPAERPPKSGPSGQETHHYHHHYHHHYFPAGYEGTAPRAGDAAREEKRRPSAGETGTVQCSSACPSGLDRQRPRQGASHLRADHQAPATDAADYPTADARAAAMATAMKNYHVRDYFRQAERLF